MDKMEGLQHATKNELLEDMQPSMSCWKTCNQAWGVAMHETKHKES